MKETMLGWWRLRTAREQRLLMAMAALAAIVLVWLAVLRPIAAAEADARLRHAQAVELLGEAKAAQAVDAAAPATQAVIEGPIDALVSRTAAEAGFGEARVVADGPDRAAVAVPAARPQAFFAWIADMEGQGLIVESLSATANSDRTLAVEASFTARRR